MRTRLPSFTLAGSSPSQFFEADDFRMRGKAARILDIVVFTLRPPDPHRAPAAAARGDEVLARIVGDVGKLVRSKAKCLLDSLEGPVVRLSELGPELVGNDDRT